MTTLKYADEGIVEGLAAAWGSPSRRDRHGEYFDSSTDFALDLFPGPRPLLYHHGVHQDVGTSVIGRITNVEKRAEGLWVRAVLDKASRWFERVKAMLARGELAFSTATLSHLINMDQDKRIARWPLVEVSLTPSPADPAARVVSVKYSIGPADLARHLAAMSSPVRGISPADVRRVAIGAARARVTELEREDLRALQLAFERERFRAASRR
jgi:hypothetical protein